MAKTSGPVNQGKTRKLSGSGPRKTYLHAFDALFWLLRGVSLHSGRDAAMEGEAEWETVRILGRSGMRTIKGYFHRRPATSERR
jgi:hypothetical protein